MQSPKIKICGITNEADMLLAAELGADFLGFNFYPASPRYLPPEQAAQFIHQLHGPVNRTGLFVNATVETITETARLCHLDTVQLHGDETPDFCRILRQKGLVIMKALRIRRRDDVHKMDDYPADYYLLDAFHPSLYGGTGDRFDWSWLDQARPGRKIFLAGGVNPDTILAAMQTGLYGIDLCSGVEQSPGHKDAAKMRLLFDRIRQYG